MDFFRQLGDEIERRWAFAHYNQQAFPEIAVQMLQRLRPSDHVSYYDIIEWVHDAVTLPPQDCLKDTFGDPPVAVYRASRFYIEILFWLQPTTVIHEHSFCGAFHLLSGNSLEVQYAFETRERFSERLALGQLTRTATSQLGQGDVVPIFAGAETIHSVFHLDKPTVSVVVRTYHSPDVGPQREFHLSGLAVDPEYLPDTMAKRVRTLFLLRASQSDAYSRLAKRFIEAADALSAYWLTRTLANDVSLEELTELLSAARRLDRTLLEVLLELARELRRERAIASLCKVTDDPDRRYFLGLMLGVRDRAEILRLLASRFPHANAVDLLAEWGSTLDVNSVGSSMWDDGSRGVLRHLLRGGTSETLLRDLERDHSPAAVQEVTSDIQRLESAITMSSLFGPLCTNRWTTKPRLTFPVAS